MPCLKNAHGRGCEGAEEAETHEGMQVEDGGAEGRGVCGGGGAVAEGAGGVCCRVVIERGLVMLGDERGIDFRDYDPGLLREVVYRSVVRSVRVQRRESSPCAA